MFLTHKFITVCGLKVNIVQIPDIIGLIESWIKERNNTAYIVTTNANTIVLGRKDHRIQEAVNHSDLSIADGYSLVFFSRFYGHAFEERAYGPDLMLEFLNLSEEKGYSNFFYGSTDETLKLLVKSLKDKFPRLKIAGYYSPPFGASVKSEEKEIEIINKTNPDVVWVGLGGVKQELWMYEHKDKLDVPVLVGVGAAFDFLAGTKPQAPSWMREAGLEWLFRLITEPKRLWRRYLVNNTLFIYFVVVELLLKIFTIQKITPSQKNQGI